jgi:predicted nucleotidyltransferase
MEDIKNRLGNKKYIFFEQLSNYLNVELLFFGSIKRFDYFDNSSDIDIIIIDDNVNSLLFKIKNYLHLNNSSIKKIYQQYTVHDKGIIDGYKIKYEDKENDIMFDLLIYDEKYRNKVEKNIDDINFLPLYMIIILYILKYLYYKLCIMSKSLYVYLKCHLFYCYFNGEYRFYKKELSPVIMVDLQ